MMTQLYLDLVWISGRVACGNFFGLPPWNKYVNGGGCGPVSVTDPKEFINITPRIGLAVLEMLLRVAGTAAVVFVIYGGIRYIISQGNSDQLAEARNTIVNALVGLIIAIIAVAVVQYIGNTLGAR